MWLHHGAPGRTGGHYAARTGGRDGGAMKLVLSRKGFDSENGGYPSPIFPDGRLYSLPIDYGGGSRTRYRDIGAAAGPDPCAMGAVVEQLTGGRVRGDALAHLDPDLDAGALPRLPGWRLGNVEGHVRALYGCAWPPTPPRHRGDMRSNVPGEVIELEDRDRPAVTIRSRDLCSCTA